MTKTCTRCKQTKPLDEYYNEKRTHCTECERETARDRMRKYNATFRGRAMLAYRDAKRTAAKYKVFDDLKPHDVLFTFAMSEGECTYCGQVTEDYELEHVIPFSKGGPNTISNIAVACPTCNRSKQNHALFDWQERTDRTDQGEIMQTIFRMASRRGVEMDVIIDELREQAGGKS